MSLLLTFYCKWASVHTVWLQAIREPGFLNLTLRCYMHYEFGCLLTLWNGKCGYVCLVYFIFLSSHTLLCFRWSMLLAFRCLTCTLIFLRCIMHCIVSDACVKTNVNWSLFLSHNKILKSYRACIYSTVSCIFPLWLWNGANFDWS